MSLRKLPEVNALKKPDWLNFEVPDQSIEAFDMSVISADEGGSNEISIYGQIGIDPFTGADNSERRISAALRSIGKHDVTVSINSPGGNFFSGLAIYNLLRTHPAKVTVNILSMAGSAASVIAMAGDEILMADGSFIEVHNASSVIIGNKFDARDAVEILSDIDGAMAQVYAARSGADIKTAAGWMDRHRGNGTRFNTSSAIEQGLADGKLASSAIKVKADASKAVPRERVMENALVAAANMSPQEAKTFIADLKSGTRDAPVNVTRDADDLKAALQQLRSTIRS